ncbi:pectate lyase [Podospora fimiseda]|uniref:Pectate lyase n=1 Tax=Podospora fimiseda TaxID=252190 RepID=A0AAN6YPH3_9PEZI|nr:pectate lyase [Podospora fimiseda]
MHSHLFVLLASTALVTAQNTNLQTVFPVATATTHLAAARTIAAGQTFDGGMKQWDRNPSTCNQQAEGGEKDAVFILQDGATLNNVIVGPNNGEGIHCKGKCTLNNIWWTDVCEDAATFKQTSSSSTSYVNGGGARHASDKIFQHNGGGTLSVKNFYAYNSGKLYRSCGNCGTQYARHSTFTNVKVENIKVIAGVNANYGDTTVIRNSCVKGGGNICEIFNGNNGGKEPSKIGSGPEGRSCVAEGVRTSGC